MSTIARDSVEKTTPSAPGNRHHAGRLPSFMIVGAPRAGTTTLHEYLGRHHQVFMCDPKEPCFFSDDDIWSRGPAWYASLFANAADNQVCGEASTRYARWPHYPDSAPRIARLCSNAKLIYIMRHPVDRAYSHYAHQMRMAITMRFEDALAADTIHVDCSLYMRQIGRLLEFFSRAQLLPLIFDDLRDDPAGVLRQIQDFIGVPSVDLVANRPVTANTSGPEILLTSRMNRAARWIRSAPGGGVLKRSIPKSWRTRLYTGLRGSRVGKLLVCDYRLPPMEPETRAMLLARFKPETQELEEFLHRSLPSWYR